MVSEKEKCGQTNISYSISVPLFRFH